jgi:hypothetical protein
MARPTTRSPSGHDIPIPESVFQAVAAVQAENRETRAEVAELRSDVKEINVAVKKLAARRNSNMVDLAKIIIPAVLTIVGAQRALAPSPEPTRVEVHQTPISQAAAAECMSIQPGTQAQTECFARVQAEIQSGKRSANPTP